MRLSGLIANVNTLVNRADMLPEDKRSEIKQSLKQVSEALLYSDPIGNAAVQENDAEIARMITELSGLFTAERVAEIEGVCRTLCEKIAQRNELLKLSKLG